MRVTWSRHGPGGYEVSSKGDHRFSPLFAELPDGRTIEEAYQLDVKGYRARGITDWRRAKGRRPLRRMTDEQLYRRFLQLWAWWAWEHRADIDELRVLARGHLTDTFATGPVNQARALADLLNDPRDPLDI